MLFTKYEGKEKKKNGEKRSRTRVRLLLNEALGKHFSRSVILADLRKLTMSYTDTRFNQIITTGTYL